MPRLSFGVGEGEGPLWTPMPRESVGLPEGVGDGVCAKATVEKAPCMLMAKKNPITVPACHAFRQLFIVLFIVVSSGLRLVSEKIILRLLVQSAMASSD